MITSVCCAWYYCFGFVVFCLILWKWALFFGLIGCWFVVLIKYKEFYILKPYLTIFCWSHEIMSFLYDKTIKYCWFLVGNKRRNKRSHISQKHWWVVPYKPKKHWWVVPYKPKKHWWVVPYKPKKHWWMNLYKPKKHLWVEQGLLCE